MTYDHELTLISHTWEENEIGVQIPVETKTTVLCGLKSISRDEFYSAAVTGLKPAMVFVIHEYEYNGEREVEFEGARYKVIRTYRGGMARQGSRLAFDEMELTCERVSTDG
ncbi:phage head closure protein [Desulfofalx alkaliphila]|uniref:phage head closure protein n=1 Tax=Desulfofalx alkaliphila TaxID=105483 RepID=UPI0004E15CB7|nr:phage head closure protein [Desulfofalx alkaliphila]